MIKFHKTVQQCSYGNWSWKSYQKYTEILRISLGICEWKKFENKSYE